MGKSFSFSGLFIGYLAIESIRTLNCYCSAKNATLYLDQKLLESVNSHLEKLPWFYRIPILVYASLLHTIVILIGRKRINKLSIPAREKIVAYLQKIPFFDLVYKLCKSIAILSVYDLCKPTTQE